MICLCLGVSLCLFFFLFFSFFFFFWCSVAVGQWSLLIPFSDGTPHVFCQSEKGLPGRLGSGRPSGGQALVPSSSAPSLTCAPPSQDLVLCFPSSTVTCPGSGKRLIYSFVFLPAGVCTDHLLLSLQSCTPSLLNLLRLLKASASCPLSSPLPFSLPLWT